MNNKKGIDIKNINRLKVASLAAFVLSSSLISPAFAKQKEEVVTSDILFEDMLEDKVTSVDLENLDILNTKYNILAKDEISMQNALSITNTINRLGGIATINDIDYTDNQKEIIEKKCVSRTTVINLRTVDSGWMQIESDFEIDHFKSDMYAYFMKNALNNYSKTLGDEDARYNQMNIEYNEKALDYLFEKNEVKYIGIGMPEKIATSDEVSKINSAIINYSILYNSLDKKGRDLDILQYNRFGYETYKSFDEPIIAYNPDWDIREQDTVYQIKPDVNICELGIKINKSIQKPFIKLLK